MNRVSYRSDIVGFGLHMICMMYIYYDCSDPRLAPLVPRPAPPWQRLDRSFIVSPLKILAPLLPVPMYIYNTCTVFYQ